jgi:hypothetical protein
MLVVGKLWRPVPATCPAAALLPTRRTSRNDESGRHRCIKLGLKVALHGERKAVLVDGLWALGLNNLCEDIRLFLAWKQAQLSPGPLGPGLFTERGVAATVRMMTA